ncbi:hypothetical protein O181_027166 [Austropuccinia psidii MF-1]|uniref:Uncharacterized protein n=1 Tax=Austropuccinia psidii MF-1 TaxID=1389203 RepID=A0A9Q3H170_9BASI|nr:hypothetical protein [Austropuccinia psidii MF-1]
MTTRRGSQYSIQSDGGGLRSRVDLSKGKRKGKIPIGTESIQGSVISKRQVPDMPIVSEPELGLCMSSSNGDKLHSEGSNRHSYQPAKAVSHGVQGQILGNISTNTPRSYELLEYPETIPQRGGNSEIIQWVEYTIIQASNKEDKEISFKKEGGKEGRSPSSFYQKAPSQPNSPRSKEEQEKELEEALFPKLQDPKNSKTCHGQCFQHGRNLDGIEGQRGTKNETTSFPKEITLSPDVVNTLIKIRNSILPLKDIKNSLLLLEEINNSL